MRGSDLDPITPVTSPPQIRAAFRNAAIGDFRRRGVVNLAQALRRDAAQVRPLLMALDIVKQ